MVDPRVSYPTPQICFPCLIIIGSAIAQRELLSHCATGFSLCAPFGGGDQNHWIKRRECCIQSGLSRVKLDQL